MCTKVNHNLAVVDVAIIIIITIIITIIIILTTTIIIIIIIIITIIITIIIILTTTRITSTNRTSVIDIVLPALSLSPPSLYSNANPHLPERLYRGRPLAVPAVVARNRLKGRKVEVREAADEELKLLVAEEPQGRAAADLVEPLREGWGVLVGSSGRIDTSMDPQVSLMLAAIQSSRVGIIAPVPYS